MVEPETNFPSMSRPERRLERGMNYQSDDCSSECLEALEEYSAVVIKQEGVVPYYQPPPAEKPRSNAQTRENEADDHHSYHRDSSREGDHDVHDLRRRFGAGTREVHNKLEKNRRAHLKECFELVKKQLPASHEKKASNLNILHSALRFIQQIWPL
ncbi:hypothetical protein RUM43_011284 [Polyplax serrata]|uniref:BHLH domain-containing protein n=1 Tax=Polyplax serrata TaxID=468196 RepID=A0AAN8NTH5_POLSC